MLSLLWNLITYGAGYLWGRFRATFLITIAVVLGFNIVVLVSAGFEGFLASIILTLLLICPVCLAIGIYGNIKALPFRKKQNRFEEMFKAIKLVSANGEAPIFLEEEEIEYLRIYTFKTQVPLGEWIKKQDLLETNLNVRITEIRNYPGDNNMVHVLTVKEELPANIFWSDNYMIVDHEWLNLGVGYEDYVGINLNKSPHTFIAGETGSGKSNILKGLIYQCLHKGHEVKLIDFKRGVSFFVFGNLVEVHSEYDEINAVLQDLVEETNRRLDLLKESMTEDILQYNKTVSSSMRLNRIVVFIDELAELLTSSDRETNKRIRSSLETLTRLSRAAGINLIMGIQRPDSTIISGQIKNNVSLRICGRFVDPQPSRIMLGNDLASKLPNVRGRFIFKNDNCKEFQAFRITNDIIKPFLEYKAFAVNRDQPKEMQIEKPTIENSITNQWEDISSCGDAKSQSSFDFGFDDIEV